MKLTDTGNPYGLPVDYTSKELIDASKGMGYSMNIARQITETLGATLDPYVHDTGNSQVYLAALTIRYTHSPQKKAVLLIPRSGVKNKKEIKLFGPKSMAKETLDSLTYKIAEQLRTKGIALRDWK